jgi:hypothetical protein
VFFNKKEQKVFNNIEQLQTAKVGSNLKEPQETGLGIGGFIRCILGFTGSKSLPIGFAKCTKEGDYQGITSRDVFANYEAFSTRNQGQESALQKLAVVVAFGSGILLICFSVFLVF